MKKMILSTLVLTAGVLGALVFHAKPSPEHLRKSCLEVMGRNDCVIMHNAAFLPKAVKQIFVPGFGALDADVFRGLKSSGVYMCDQIREACSSDEQGPICQFGQAMYSGR